MLSFHPEIKFKKFKGSLCSKAEFLYRRCYILYKYSYPITRRRYGRIIPQQKRMFSINVQAICDHDLILTNVVARWPGSTHDSRIFENSNICARLERREIQDILIGDNGYPLIFWGSISVIAFANLSRSFSTGPPPVFFFSPILSNSRFCTGF